MVRTLKIKTDGADLLRQNEALRAENRTLRQIISEFKGMSDKRTIGALGETLTAGRFGLKLVSGNKGWDLTTRDDFKVELKYSSFRKQGDACYTWRFNNVWCKDHCDAVLFMGQVPPLIDIAMIQYGPFSLSKTEQKELDIEIQRMERFVYGDSFYSLIPWSILTEARQAAADFKGITLDEIRTKGRFALSGPMRHVFERKWIGNFWESSFSFSSLRRDLDVLGLNTIILLSLFAIPNDYIRKGGLDSLLSSVDLHNRASQFSKIAKKTLTKN